MSRRIYCEKCGAPLAPGDNFCDSCGVPVPKLPAGRYHQEDIDAQWQQDWERMSPVRDEKKVTPFQIFLIGIAAVLVMALIWFGVYWATKIMR